MHGNSIHSLADLMAQGDSLAADRQHIVAQIKRGLMHRFRLLFERRQDIAAMGEIRNVAGAAVGDSFPPTVE